MEAFQSEWMSMRRGGGGGGDPIARPIGVMMLLLLPLGSLAHYTGQNQMCAAMIVGIIFGSSNLDASGSNTALSAEVIYAFIELGNALVMFFDGLADADVGVITYSGAVASIKIGVSTLVFTTGLFAGIGYGLGLCTSSTSTVFFGLACSLSSKKVIVNFLKKTGSLQSMHGRLLQALSFFQDIVMLVALTVLYALKRNIIIDARTNLAASNETEGIVRGMSTTMMHTLNIDYSRLPDVVMHAGDSASTEVLRSFGIFAVMIVVIFCLKRFRLLEKTFDFYAADGEMLFIGTMSYALGTYAICYQLGVSPMTGAYLAGYSLSQLPYQVQIENKIQSLQTFGMTLFYFMLGCYVKLDSSFLQTSFAKSVVVTAVQVTTTPLFYLFVIWEVGLKSRTALYTALLSNSLGETSLTLMVVAFQAGVFSRNVFEVLVCATIVSVVVSGCAHPFLGGIYARVRPFLSFMDRTAAKEQDREARMPFDHHVVILGFDETGAAAAEFFRMTNRDVYHIDLDLPLHRILKSGYKGTMPRHPPRITSRTSLHGAEFLVPASSLGGTDVSLGVPIPNSVRIRFASMKRPFHATAGDAGETKHSPILQPQPLFQMDADQDGAISPASRGETRPAAEPGQASSGNADAFTAFNDFSRGTGPSSPSSRQEASPEVLQERERWSSLPTVATSQMQGAGAGADDFSAFVEFSRGIAESPRPRCREEEEQRVRSLSHPGPRTLEGTGIDVDFSAFEDFSRGRSDQRSDAAPDSDQAGGESAVVAGSCFGNEGAATNGKEPLSSEHGAGGDDAGQAGREGSVGAVAGTRRSAVEMEASRSQGHAATEALQVTPISFLKDSEVEHGGAAVDANEIQVALRSASGVDEGGQGLTGNGQHQGSNSGVDQYLSSAPQRRVLSRTSLDFPSRSSTDADKTFAQTMARSRSLDLGNRARASLETRRTSSEYQYAGARLRRDNADFLETVVHESNFHVDGHRFGGHTNIISLYADPELEETWEHYRLKEAALIISCMSTRFKTNLKLCEYMAGTNVPVVVVCQKNSEAEEMYKAGCTYAQQPLLTSAHDMMQILHEEMVLTNNMFRNRALDHQDLLDEEEEDGLSNSIGKFT